MKKKVLKNKGQVVIITLLLFLGIAGIIIASIAIPISNQIKNARGFFNSKQSYVASETVSDEVLYRLNKGFNVPSNIVLSFSNGVSGTAVVTDLLGTAKEIMSEGASQVYRRKVKAVFFQGEGVSINFGLQVGNGGLSMAGGATVNGNVYANGSIFASGNAFITGGAVAASSIDITPGAENGSSTPAYEHDLGRSINNYLIAAQSFTVSTSTPVSKFSLYVKKVGVPSNATISIMTNSGSDPSNTQVGSGGTLVASLVSTSYGWIDIYPTSAITLTPGNTYWLKISVPSASPSNYYVFGGNKDEFSNQEMKFKKSSGSWNEVTPSGQDMFFKVFHGASSYIQGPIEIGADVKAPFVRDVTASGNIYCFSGSGNNKACQTLSNAPAPAAFPVSEGNINSWKQIVQNEVDAISSGWAYTGNLSIGSSGTTTDSLRQINGNLNVNCNSGPTTFSDLYVTGDVSISGNGCMFTADSFRVGGNLDIGGSGTTTVGYSKVEGDIDIKGGMSLKGSLWVVGDVNVTASGKVSIDSSYGVVSEKILVDGIINIGGSGTFSGSGSSKSYVIVVSTNSTWCGTEMCTGNPAAVSFSGSGGAVVMFVPYGSIYLQGGGAAKSFVAHRIDMGGNSSLNYETGLADLTFTTGPSGAWNIDSWEEIDY